MDRRFPVAAALLLVACAWPATAAPARAGTAVAHDVYFVRAGKLEPVRRHVHTIPAAVAALLAGPVGAERRRGLGSAVPVSTPLRGVTIERRVVTVDLGARFAAGRDPGALRLRVGQLVHTVTSFRGVAGVRVLVQGGTPLGLFPGLDLRRPVGRAATRAPDGPSLRELQQLLVDLGYLGPGGVTGVADARTSVAVIAFEKWAGLPRDGLLGPAVASALLRASRPEPATRAPGRRIEVLLDRQLALLIESDRVVRAVHISSGAGGATPRGAFRVYRKERLSWSVPFEVWLPWASYFTGGIAFHEYPDVPTYPASHGCVRVNRYDATDLYAFAAHGTPVLVLGGA